MLNSHSLIITLREEKKGHDSFFQKLDTKYLIPVNFKCSYKNWDLSKNFQVEISLDSLLAQLLYPPLKHAYKWIKTFRIIRNRNKHFLANVMR